MRVNARMVTYGVLLVRLDLAQVSEVEADALIVGDHVVLHQRSRVLHCQDA